jgi:hypothetical protein
MALEPTHDCSQQQAGDRENQQAGEHKVGLKLFTGSLDQGTDTMLSTQQLGHEHADQRLPHREPQPAENERHGARQSDGAEDLEIIGAETACDADQVRVETADAAARVHQHGKNRDQENKRHFGIQADAEPDDEKRPQRDAWNGIEKIDEWIEEISDPRIPSNEKTGGDANDRRKSEAIKQFTATRGEVGPDIGLRGCEQIFESVHHRPRRRQNDRRLDTEGGHQFPYDKHNNDKGGA